MARLRLADQLGDPLLELATDGEVAWVKVGSHWRHARPVSSLTFV